MTVQVQYLKVLVLLRLTFVLTFVEELMGWMERTISYCSVISYSWYGRMMEFAEL